MVVLTGGRKAGFHSNRANDGAVTHSALCGSLGMTHHKNDGKFDRGAALFCGFSLQVIEQTCGCKALKPVSLSHIVSKQSRKIDEEREPCIRAKENQFYFKTGKSADVVM